MNVIIVNAAWHASQWHKEQYRKYNGEPYIMHPMRVAGRATMHRALMANDREHVNAIAAAWLHDVVEDCNVDPKTLLHLFGDDVASLVIALTNPSKGSDKPRAERKAMDREHIAKASYRAKIIKMLDRIDNLAEMNRDFDRALLSSKEKKFFDLYRDETALLLNEALVGTDKELEEELARLL